MCARACLCVRACVSVSVCQCACVCACVRACVCVCVLACVRMRACMREYRALAQKSIISKMGKVILKQRYCEATKQKSFFWSFSIRFCHADISTVRDYVQAKDTGARNSTEKNANCRHFLNEWGIVLTS